MEELKQRIEKLKEVFATIDPNVELVVEDNEDGSCMIFGPFPSFIIAAIPEETFRVLVHVNSDAPNMSYIFYQFAKAGIEVEFDGAFAVVEETQEIIMNEDAYKKKEDNILLFAEAIKEQRKQELIVPEEKKIILSR